MRRFIATIYGLRAIDSKEVKRASGRREISNRERGNMRYERSFLIPADITRILIYGSARSNYIVTELRVRAQADSVKNRSSEITIHSRVERRFEVINIANKCRQWSIL